MRYPANSHRHRRSPNNSGLFKLLLTLFVIALVTGGLFGAVKLIGFLSTQYNSENFPVGIVDQESSSSPEQNSSPVSNQEENPFLEKTGLNNKSYSFEYQCQSYSLTLPLYGSVYEYYAALDKGYYYQGTLPTDWQGQYYLGFLESNQDQEIIDYLIDTVSIGLDINDSDELVIAITSFVQNLTYDCQKLFSYENLDGKGFETNFPYETLFLQEGVCGDFSILLGKILNDLGYGAAFFVFDHNNHMAVGIECPVGNATYIQDGVGYCYIETTASGRIGVKPTQFNGINFTEKPEIIKIANGKSFQRMILLAQEMERDAQVYGNYILQLTTCEEVDLYKEIQTWEAGLRQADNQLDELAQALDGTEAALDEEYNRYNAMGCKGSLGKDQYKKCLAQGDVVDLLRDDYNNLVEEFNSLRAAYQDDYDQYAVVFNIFEALMEQSYQGCSNVFPESLLIHSPPEVQGE